MLHPHSGMKKEDKQAARTVTALVLLLGFCSEDRGNMFSETLMNLY
jgi:hypothetical protein